MNEQAKLMEASTGTATLQEITTAWGKWMAKKYPAGGGVKYTESTDYNKQKSLDQYHQYQTNVVDSTLTYDQHAPSPKPGMVSSAKTSFNNDSSVQQSITYTQSETTTQSFHWSVTEDLKLGVKVSVTAGVPAIAKVTTEVSVGLDLSSTQGASSSKSQTWQVSLPIVCPPHSHTTAQLNVHTAEYDIGWTCETLLDGYVAIWFNKRFYMDGHTGDHHLYFIPIGNVINDCVTNNLINTNGYKRRSSKQIYAASRGKFYGGQGTEMTVDVKETPLNSDLTLNASREELAYRIPVDEKGCHGVISAD